MNWMARKLTGYEPTFTDEPTPRCAHCDETRDLTWTGGEMGWWVCPTHKAAGLR